MRNLKDIKARAFPRTAPERRADCFSVPLHRRALARVPEIPRDCPRLPESGPTSGRARSERTRAASAPRRASIASPVPRPEPAQRAVAPHGRILGFQPAVEAAVEGRRTRTRTQRCALLSCPSWVTRCSESAPARGRTPTPPHEPPARPRDQQPCGDSAGDRPQPPGSSSSEIVIGHHDPPRAGGSCVHGTASPPSCRRPAFPRRRRTSPRETRRRTRDRSRPLTRLRRDRPRDRPEIATRSPRDCAEIALEITLRGHLRDASSTRVHRR